MYTITIEIYTINDQVLDAILRNGCTVSCITLSPNNNYDVDIDGLKENILKALEIISCESEEYFEDHATKL